MYPRWLPSWSRRTQDPGSKRPSQRSPPRITKISPCWSSWPVAPRTRPSGWPPSSPMPMSGASTRTGASPGPPTRRSAWSRGPRSTCSATTTALRTPTRSTCSSRSPTARTQRSSRPRWCAGTTPACSSTLAATPTRPVRSSNAWPRARWTTASTTPCVTCSWLPAASRWCARTSSKSSVASTPASWRWPRISISLGGPRGPAPVSWSPPTRASATSSPSPAVFARRQPPPPEPCLPRSRPSSGATSCAPCSRTTRR